MITMGDKYLHAACELDLLDVTLGETMEEATANHDTSTAPLLAADVYTSASFQKHVDSIQYGVLGQLNGVGDSGRIVKPQDPRLYINTNAPFSALVCGVQGAGKSHTVSTMLESMLIPNIPSIGRLEKPLSGLVFHYGEGGQAARPCEAAYIALSSSKLASLNVKNLPCVVVYVSPTSFDIMKNVYKPLGQRVTVKPLQFTEQELDTQAFRGLMAVKQGENIPLYMHTVLNILRELGGSFTYQSFMKQLDIARKDFTPQQKGPLDQRLALLKCFVESASSSSKLGFGKGKVMNSTPRFSAGQITIIDLSDLFIDASFASTLFEIVTRMFIREDLGTGKVMLVDEAHKYLTPTSGNDANGLTKTLLRLIREQRHLGMRVIISTQEPTVVPPVLIDLCSVTILHRFSSPDWWKHITNHLSADFTQTDAFNTVVTLKNGEAIILAPQGLGYFPSLAMDTGDEDSTESIQQFGRRYLLVKSRKRVTADGGASILVLGSS